MGHIPFVHIDIRYGGPMLNTAATRMYWKHDIKNSTEFSSFLDSSLLLPPDGRVMGGGVYL